MRFLFIFITITLIGIFNTQAQTNEGEIEIHKSFGGYKFTLNGRELKSKQLTVIMKADEAAYQEYTTAGLNNLIAGVLSITGGIMVAWQAGSAIVSGDINWTLVGIGAGLVAISIPFSIAGKKKLYSAVNTYNQNLRQTSSNNINPHLKIGFNKNGVGLILKF